MSAPPRTTPTRSSASAPARRRGDTARFRPPLAPDSRTGAPADVRPLSDALLVRLSALEEGTPEYAYVRNTLVELNLSLVRFAAQRFARQSEPMEDIVQVGTVGLIKAINRFDVERGVEFASFALPTVVGEIKRYFRDASWSVRVPRRLQELRIGLAKALDTLEQELGRRPTTPELAAYLHVSETEVREAERAANGYTAQSLDTAGNDEDASSGTARRLGSEDPAFGLVEDLQSLRPLIASLDERDRLILSLRFCEELTQSEIGERLGMSQMHVSRLLGRILGVLRAGLADEG